LIALAGVLVMPTLPALAIAVVVSLGMLVWRASQARLTFLGRARGGLEPDDLRTAPEAAIPGLLIVRPDEMLFFANVASVRDAIMQATAVADPRPTVVLLDLELTPEVDVPVVEALKDLSQRLTNDGIELWLSHLQPAVRGLLDRAGALATIGPDRVHPRVVEGILAFALRMPGAGERVAVLADLLAFIRERAARPGTSAEGAEVLAALEERLSLELAAAGGASVRPATGTMTSES
jgi:SulP family sulfate permease